MNKSERFWNNQAARFDEDNQALDPTFARALDNTKGYLKRSDVVLDYGCATGSAAIALADCAKHIHGIDIASNMIAAAKRKTGGRNNIDFTHATIFSDALQEDSYDVMLAFNILHLLQDGERVMQRINNLLHPGGLFISTTACLGENGRIIGRFLRVLSFTGLVPYVHSFNIRQLEAMMTNGGFHIVEAETLSHTPAANHFVVATKH